MANLNELSCLTTAGNTGVGSCFLDFKNIVGAILAPKGYELDLSANSGDVQTTLAAACLNASKALRLYPVFDFEQTTDSSEQATVQTMNTGSKHVVREGFNDWQFQYVAGGLSLHQSLRKFNGNAWDFFFVDADNKILGVEGSDTDHIKAIPSTGGYFWATPWKVNDGSKIAEYMLQFVFNVKYSNDLVKFVKCDFDIPSTIYGCEDVTLTGVADETSGTYNITAKTSSVGTNLGDVVGSTLASASLWVATNSETGAGVDITSVSYDSTNKYYQIACDTSDTDYPGTGQHIKIDLAAPSVLDAAGVEGYESTGAVVIAKN